MQLAKRIFPVFGSCARVAYDRNVCLSLSCNVIMSMNFCTSTVLVLVMRARMTQIQENIRVGEV